MSFSRWPKYWSFSFCISPSNGYSGLISFRIDYYKHGCASIYLRSCFSSFPTPWMLNNFIFSFLRKCHIVFHSAYTILHLYQQHTKVPISHPCQQFFFFSLLFILFHSVPSLSLSFLLSFPFLFVVAILMIWGGCEVMHAGMLSRFSHVQLFVTLWTVARQASLSITNPRSLLKVISI